MPRRARVTPSKASAFPTSEEVRIEQRLTKDLPVPSYTAIADHIDHAVKVGGIDHVGLGSDFDGIDSPPRGMEDVSKIPDLVRELARRGYSEEDLEKILGGNVLRVMRQVEQVARQMQSCPVMRTGGRMSEADPARILMSMAATSALAHWRWRTLPPGQLPRLLRQPKKPTSSTAHPTATAQSEQRLAAQPGVAQAAGSCRLRCQVHHHQRGFRCRGDARVVASRGRSLLQSGEISLLRRRGVLPRDAGVCGAVRHQRPAGCFPGLGKRQDPDDPVTQSNTRGTLTFATAGPNTRTTQMFINLGDNTNLDGMGFSPFGKVTSGMEVVDKLYSEYGEGPPDGHGPDQNRIQSEGKPYLEKSFPLLDTIKTAVIVPPAPAGAEQASSACEMKVPASGAAS